MIFRTPRPIRIVLKLCLEQFERLAVSDENDIMGEELRCLDLLRVVHNGEHDACS